MITRAPFASLPVMARAECVVAGAGIVAFHAADDTFAFADAARGERVDTLELPEPRLRPRFLCATSRGDVVYAWTGAGVLVARRGAGAARHRRCSLDGSPSLAAVDGVGALVHGRRAAYLVREDLSVEPLPIPLRGDRAIVGVRWWNHDLLVETRAARDALDDDGGDDVVDETHEIQCVAGDGAVRFELRGSAPTPIDDELALVWSEGRVLVLDREGVCLPEAVGLGNAAAPGPRSPLLRLPDGDIVMKSFDDPCGLARLDPRAAATPKWTEPYPAEAPQLHNNGWPVLVGGTVALALQGFDRGPAVFVVDVDTGAPLHLLEDAGWLDLVAAGADAVACGGGGGFETSVFVGLHGRAPPRRCLLEHTGPCRAVCAPAPGVVACLVAGHDDDDDASVDLYRYSALSQ